MAKKPVKKVAKKIAKKANSAKVSRATAPKKAAKKAAKKAIKKVVPVKKQTTKKTPPVKPVKKKAVNKATKKAPVKVDLKTTSISPYLIFRSNCEEAFHLYRSVFGGDFAQFSRFNEMPPMEGQAAMPDSEGNKIMHVSLPISKETVLMGSDSSESFGHATVIGNNFSISINAININDADRFFNGLSAGGKVTMPMEKTFWGSYFGMLTDKFGINWQVSCDQK
ncbi:MAG: VOC family protein [Bacteroidota bacterium]